MASPGSSSPKGKRALVCASTRGLGLGTAKALLKMPHVECVALNGRSRESVEAAMALLVEQLVAEGEMSKDEVTRRLVAAPGDVSTAEGRTAILEAAGPGNCNNICIDILVTNAGGPPPGDFADFTEADWRAAVEQNMIAPLMLAKAVLPHMQAQRWGRIVNITSAAVRAPIPHLGLSNGARAGLTGAMAGLARQVAVYGITINNVLPGQHDTDRLRSNYRAVAKLEGMQLEQAWAVGKDKIPTKTFGDPNDFGQVVAFLCSEPAKFIVGQNIVVDGGAANISI
jgi:3-oxoacyl-[acyl-carrier protein] reductase